MENQDPKAAITTGTENAGPGYRYLGLIRTGELPTRESSKTQLGTMKKGPRAAFHAQWSPGELAD